MVHRGKDLPFVGEFHLRLGGVNIYIHCGQLGGQMKHAAGEFAHHALVGVGLLQGGSHDPGLNIASVDEKVLIVSAGFAAHGQGGKAGHAHVLSAARHFLKAQRQLPTQHGVDGGVELAVPGGEQLLLAVPNELDAHLRVRQRQSLNHRKDGRALGRDLFHELQPGRGVVKQVAHHHGRPLGTAGLLHLTGHAPLQTERRPKGRAGSARHHINARHGADGGQRLTPEAQRADGFQIVLGTQLTGGVAQKGGGQLLGRHAAAVVGDPDEGHAAVIDLHRHLLGPGVDGVFHQFLGHAGRTLHHLAGGDQVGHMTVQYTNVGHKITPLSVSVQIALQLRQQVECLDGR